MGKIKLWLDDERPAPEGWVWVNKAIYAMMFIATGNVKVCSLDNDLGEGEMEGYKVLDWLEEAQFNPGFKRSIIPTFHIHTANPVARKRMEQCLTKIRANVKKEFF